jgi:hypothetical protein
LLLPYLALATFILTEILAANSIFTEIFYSQTIYPLIAKVFSKFSSLVFFSLDDVFYVILIATFIVWLILLILRRISFKLFGKLMFNLLAGVYVLFYFLWGFNYYRPSLNNRLNIESQQPDTEEFLMVFEKLIEQTNESYISFNDIKKTKIDSVVEYSYSGLAPFLDIQYPLGKRRAKKITFSRFFAQAGISGYYGPFFNEIHVNSFVHPIEYPFVLAHEKAHQFGITSEAEANFYAWLVCSKSNSKHLNYSANLVVLRYFIYQGYSLNEFENLAKKIEEPVKTDLQQIREHWLKLRNEKIDRAATKVNDAYLKTNKIEKGVDDYYGIVQHVMDFKLDTAFQKRWNLISE